MIERYTKIILPVRPQPDTIVAIFLLKTFGKEKYPGIDEASVEILATLPEGENEKSFQEKGVFLIDIGGGEFDHHTKETTTSKLIAQNLGIADNPVFTKLLSYAERDDKYGMGTISKDSLDRAFGLSGLITALNKSIPQNTNEVVEYILPLLIAHYLEEKKRIEDLPREYQEKFEAGKAQEIEVQHKGKNVSLIILESDSPSMAGWLRSSAGKKADVVVQKMSSGYINILTKQFKKIDLRKTISFIRQTEANITKQKLSPAELSAPGRISKVPNWYYDRATNSLLNGGLNPQGVEATKISFEKIRQLVLQGLENTKINN